MRQVGIGILFYFLTGMYSAGAGAVSGAVSGSGSGAGAGAAVGSLTQKQLLDLIHFCDDDVDCLRRLEKILEERLNPKMPCDPAHSVKIYMPGRPSDDYMRKCIENSSVPEGQWTNVSRFDTVMCEKKPWWRPDVYQRGPSGYNVRKHKGQIEVSIDIYFAYLGTPDNRAASIARLESVRPCVEDFYKKQGLQLSFGYTFESKGMKAGRYDVEVNLWDQMDRANSDNWPMLADQGRTLSAKEACSIATHELGHLLGLDDEYVDPNCPDRPFIGPPDSIMRDHSGTPKLYPNHIKSILKPLCGGK